MISLLMALALQTTSPVFLSGNQLLEHCSNSDNAQLRAGCAFYVMGVSDTLRASGATTACPPRDITGIQATDVVIRFLRDNPQYRHMSAASLVVGALQSAFPCR